MIRTKRKMCLAITIHILFAGGLCAQSNASVSENEISILKNKIEQADNVSKGELFLSISEKYTQHNNDSSTYYARSAQKHASISGDKELEAKALRQLGEVHIYQKFFPEAKRQLDSSLNLFHELEDNEGLSDIYNTLAHLSMRMGNLDTAAIYLSEAAGYLEIIKDTVSLGTNKVNTGIVYIRKGDFVLALDCMLKAIELFESLDEPDRLADAYMNTGVIYNRNEELEKSLEYYNKALNIYKKQGNSMRVGHVSFNIANIYNNQKKWDLAIEHINIYIKVNEESGNIRALGRAYGAIGTVYKDKGDYSNALHYFKKAYANCKESNDVVRLAEQSNNLGHIYFLLGDYNKAIQFAQKAMEYSDQHTMLQNSYQILDDSYKKLGNYKKAYEVKNNLFALKDSIGGMEIQKQLDELEVKFEAEKKEKEIIVLRDENNKKEIELLRANQTKFIFIGITSLFIIISVFIYIYARKRQQQKQYELKTQKIDFENRLLRAQINPHFIYNCLNSVQGYILNKNENKAVKYLADFGKLIRSSLDFSMQEMISLDQEIEILRIFMELEKQRLGVKLNYEIKVDENLESDSIMIPPMMLQPFVENSIKHGISPKKDGGFVSVSIMESENHSELLCQVRDNGIGRHKTLENKKQGNYKSYGQKLIKDRLDVLEKKYRKNFSYKIEDITDNNEPGGTLVKIALPCLFDN